MIELVRKHPIPVVISAFVLGLLVVAAVWITASAISNADDDGTSAGLPSQHATATPTGSPQSSSSASAARPTECGDATTTVSSTSELTAALREATPGDVIAMSPGTYDGNFVATTSGSAGKMITLCGTSASILDGGSTSKGYVFHLDQASYWHLVGFTVTDGQKGVMADGTVGSVIERLTVHDIGDEAIHLRNFSTDNTVTGNTVSDTGRRRAKYGEGIYIGTANSNWCVITRCQPDTSDRNVVENNTVSATTAENVDIKEGTSDGVLRGNIFNGMGMSDADSWVDVKGNGWTIEGNTGQNSPGDGFQVHNVYNGWGTDNVFVANAAAVNGPGYGIHLAPVQANRVLCSNTETGAKQGLSNVKCSSS